MSSRRVGIWLIGAYGGVGTTVAMGLSAISRGISKPIGLVTSLPQCAKLDLDDLSRFIVGGHDIRTGSFLESAKGLNRRSNIFSFDSISGCSADLELWSKNVRPGIVLQANETIQALADRTDLVRVSTSREAIERIQNDIREFAKNNALAQVVVINVASTEPPSDNEEYHHSLAKLQQAIATNKSDILPTSGLYAYAAIEAGFAYVNFTPSFGASCVAIEELAQSKKVPVAGKDGKTGETLLKTVLAPMFAARNLEILSWVGHNILGGGDGRVLNDPANKASKVKSKDAVLGDILGYKPHSLVSIEYVESLDDWKTAWDHIHFEGFLGTKMTLQFTWQGCDSILAAPLVIDLARLTLLAQRRDEAGTLSYLACFFKSPMGTKEQDFFKQFCMFNEYLLSR